MKGVLHSKWRVEHPVRQAGFYIFLFPLKGKLWIPVCSTVPDCKPEAVGQGIAIRAKVEQAGIHIFSLSDF